MVYVELLWMIKKVVVVSFQDKPVGICPDLVLTGNAQTFNESITFEKRLWNYANQDPSQKEIVLPWISPMMFMQSGLE